jgi:DNA-binding response OmpR family regulator
MDQTLKILIVDDEPTGRQLLQAILYPEGHNLLFAENGEEALKLTIENIPSIVLLDVMMPKLDGFEVCRQIRQNENTAHISIFLITALDDRDSRIKGIAAGADDYISKPYDRIEILAKIKNRVILDQFRFKAKNPHNNQTNSSLNSGKNLILDCAINHLLTYEKSGNNAQVDIYRTNQVFKSKYAFISIPKSEGNFYIMVSNKAEGINAAIINILIHSIFNKEINSNDVLPSQLIQSALEKITQIASEYNLSTLIETNYSFIILHLDLVKANFLVSGLNQTIFFSLHTDPKTNSTNNQLFQSFYLMGNQDMELNGLKEMIFFSENIQEIFSQPDLISFINSNLKSGILPPLSQIIPTKFDQNDDILVVKLSF